MTGRFGERRVVVLDRDGTLVIDRGYLADPAGLEFLPGTVAGLLALQARGFRLLVVTNQSGVGRGLFDIDSVERVHARLGEMLAAAGIRLEAIYYCPHEPAAGCDCRKPATGLMRRAERELGFAAGEAIVIGDKASDMEFGLRSGAATLFVTQEPVPEEVVGLADGIVANLEEAAALILAAAPDL